MRVTERDGLPPPGEYWVISALSRTSLICWFDIV